MSRPLLTPSPRCDTAMATAEYAVGTLGAGCIGCIILQLYGDDTFVELFRIIFSQVQLLVDALETTPILPASPILRVP